MYVGRYGNTPKDPVEAGSVMLGMDAVLVKKKSFLLRDHLYIRLFLDSLY